MKWNILKVLVSMFILIRSSQSVHPNGPCSGKSLPFACGDDTCILRNEFCDDTLHCIDGSDEIPYNSSIHNRTHGFECNLLSNDATKTCLLPIHYQCDHELDCVGGEDECNCSSTFQCDNGDCALRIQFCDWNEDCADGSDERLYEGIGFQCIATKMHERKKCKLPDVHVCDGSSECSWGTDECFCDFSGGTKGKELNETYSNDRCFRCLDGSLVIPNNQVCDKIVHCKDLSDECLCEHKTSSNITKLCGSVCTGLNCDCPGQLRCIPKSGNTEKEVCIPNNSICDEKNDCENELDETFCAMNNVLFACNDTVQKIRRLLRCDGISDCEDGSDEWDCHETKFICHLYRGMVQEIPVNSSDWNDPELAPRLNRTTVPFFMHEWPYYADACDGIPQCAQRINDECDNDLCPEDHNPEYCEFARMHLMCPNTESMITALEVCDGQPTCNDTAPEKSIDEAGCPGRFYCADRGAKQLPIHIPEENQCDGKQECYDVSDELDCSNKTHYYCRDRGTPLFIPVEQKCDRRKDCSEGGDECENCEESPFSSDQKLIKSRVLVVFLWMIGIFATAGNLAIIVHQVTNILMMKRDANQVAVWNRIMVLNLAVADFLTGIYLISLGVKDATTDKYCLEDQDWRSSTTCSALGAIAVVGMEASVLILLVMTAYRLYLVHTPYQRQQLSIILVSLIFCWIFAILLGTAPFSTTASDYFLSCVWFRTHRYLGYTCRANITEFTKKLITFEGPDKRFSRAVGSSYTWDSMLAAQRALNSEYVPEKYFGYYSAHSVCLPRLFPDKDDDRSWSYSMFLVLLNFCAFVFILVSYICIYRHTTNTGLRAASAADRSAVLQRKITRIVLTDFCCWMPICLMAFITLAGVDIDPVAYAVTAIILLPINSAMNPFLYSSLVDIIWEQLEPVRKSFREGVCGISPIIQQLSRTGRGTVATMLTKVKRYSDSNNVIPSAVDTRM